jgi:RimJ/RimL family protein N-acetyltransferase
VASIWEHDNWDVGASADGEGAVGARYIRFEVYIEEVGSELVEHVLRATAVGAPFGAVHGDCFVHSKSSVGGDGIIPRHDGVMTFSGIEWPVLTERLAIRPATSADGEATWRYRRTPSVAMWMTSSSADLAEFLAKFEQPDRMAKTLIIERGGVIIGDLMLAIENAWSQSEVSEQAKDVQAEIGWCLDAASTGQGYATEAVRELIRICFDELKLRRLTANCFADNVASSRLMERVGMRRELHEVRGSLHRTEGWVDSLGYALLAEEWRDEVSKGSLNLHPS